MKKKNDEIAEYEYQSILLVYLLCRHYAGSPILPTVHMLRHALNNTSLLLIPITFCLALSFLLWFELCSCTLYIGIIYLTKGYNLSHRLFPLASLDGAYQYESIMQSNTKL